MLRTGLLGGTFDPLHYGHLLAAEAAREAADLTEIWLVPSFIPPHKPGPDTDSKMRLGMLEAAVADIPGYRIEPIEFARQGVSYTIDTVTDLTRRHPDREFYWIVGSDMANDLPNWREPEALASLVTFIALERPDAPLDEDKLPAYIRSKLVRAPMPRIGLSSTDIRKRCREGRSIRFMTPDPVYEWIRRHRLYEY